MSTYTYTTTHHSIASHWSGTYDGTLIGAMRAAWRDMGSGYIGHTIVIRDDRGETVASRVIGGRGGKPGWRKH